VTSGQVPPAPQTAASQRVAVVRAVTMRLFWFACLERSTACGCAFRVPSIGESEDSSLFFCSDLIDRAVDASGVSRLQRLLRPRTVEPADQFAVIFLDDADAKHVGQEGYDRISTRLTWPHFPKSLENSFLQWQLRHCRSSENEPMLQKQRGST